MSAPTTPPEPDELEVSLFGPGFGECVVVHAGWGDWIIVDSCIGPDGKMPAGLDYLNRIGVDPSKSVKRVVATHWHNDHVRGLSQTVAACTSAKFICSQALWSKEFIALTELWKQQRSPASSVSELSAVLETLAKSNALLKGGVGDIPFGFAIANRCLWRRMPASEAGEDISAELHSLSPSDAAVHRSLQVIAEMCLPRSTLTRPMPSRPNQFSVVLWLRVSDVRLLLGADMEEQNNPYGGWTVISASAERPGGQASLFKIPHHGSATGKCEAVWTNMLVENPIAMLTPFSSGRTRLPTREDVDQICGWTSDAFITASVRDRSSRGKAGSVNRTIHETVRYIRRANDSDGHVRARQKLKSGQWQVTTFGDARPLAEFYAQRSA